MMFPVRRVLYDIPNSRTRMAAVDPVVDASLQFVFLSTFGRQAISRRLEIRSSQQKLL
jgi:hypothetical protein